MAKKDFFISYNHKDTTWAEWTAWQLEEAGYTTVIQAWDFGAGSNFVLKMQEAAAETERTIAVLSPDYLASRFTAPEWAAAFARDPMGDEGTLLTVRVHECELKGLLPQIVYIDFVGVEESAAKLRLLEGVKRGRRKPATAPVFPGGGTHSGEKEPPSFPGASAPAVRTKRQRPSDPNYLFFNVPPLPKHFLGRDELLSEMVSTLTSNTGAVALSARGQAGVGKTTLAVAIAHSPEIIEHFTDGVLWAGLGLNADVASTLASWGDAMGVSLSEIMEARERAQAIRNHIGLRRMLLVSDDVWDRDTALLLKQCGGPNCVHLLTTRDDAIANAFAPAKGSTRVPALEDAPAVELLRQLAPEAYQADPQAVADLARTVGGLPLALELLGGYLAEPEHSAFSELRTEALVELSDPKQRLELAQVRLGSRTGAPITLRDTILLSLEALPDQAVEAFYALGAFAPKPETFDLSAAKAVTGQDGRTLALLTRRNLVEQGEEDTLAIHQTIADAARDNLPSRAREHYINYYLELVLAAGHDWRQIESAYGQISWAFDTTSDEERVLQFIRMLSRYHLLRGLWANELRWSLRGLSIAEAHQDEHMEAVLLTNIGLVYSNIGDFPRALEYYRRALPVQREFGDRASEAMTLNNIGLVFNTLGDRKLALEYFEQAFIIQRNTTILSGEGVILNNIGFVLDCLGDRRKALDYYERALEIRREVKDKQGEAATLNNIGLVYDHLGNYNRALKYYNLALPIKCAIGDRAGEAAALNNIGFAYNNWGRPQEALRHLQNALTILRDISDRAGEATTLNNLGQVMLGLGEESQALDYYESALRIRRAVGDRVGEAATLNNIGGVYNARGNRKQALDYFQRALPIQREVGDRASEAVTRFNIASIHRAEGRLAQALEELRRVVELDEQVQSPDLDSDRTALSEVEQELATQQKGA